MAVPVSTSPSLIRRHQSPVSSMAEEKKKKSSSFKFAVLQLLVKLNVFLKLLLRQHLPLVRAADLELQGDFLHQPPTERGSRCLPPHLTISLSSSIAVCTSAAHSHAEALPIFVFMIFKLDGVLM